MKDSFCTVIVVCPNTNNETRITIYKTMNDNFPTDQTYDKCVSKIKSGNRTFTNSYHADHRDDRVNYIHVHYRLDAGSDADQKRKLVDHALVHRRPAV